MENKSGSKSGSKPNLNESTLPLLEEQEKGETPEKEEKIEMEMKGNDAEKDEKNGDKDEKDSKGKKKKEKKVKEPKIPKEKKEGVSRTPLACAQNFTIGLNVHDRDEKRINEHVNLTFEDIIGETDSNQGFEFIWRLTFLMFNFTKFWLYRILAAIISVPLAVLWAVVFALVNIVTVWGCTPTLRIFDVLLHFVHRFWSGLVRTFLDPLFKSCGLCFANIQTKRETSVVPSAAV